MSFAAEADEAALGLKNHCLPNIVARLRDWQNRYRPLFVLAIRSCSLHAPPFCSIGNKVLFTGLPNIYCLLACRIMCCLLACQVKGCLLARQVKGCLLACQSVISGQACNRQPTLVYVAWPPPPCSQQVLVGGATTEKTGRHYRS